MATFKDNEKRDWLVAVTVEDIKQVRARLDGLDLADVYSDTLNRLADDPVLLVDVLWVLCEEQAKTAGVTDRQFGRAMAGDSIVNATTALVEAVTDFSHGQKKLLAQKSYSHGRKMTTKGMELALTKLNDPELEAQMVAAMESRATREIDDLLTRLNSPTNSED